VKFVISIWNYQCNFGILTSSFFFVLTFDILVYSNYRIRVISLTIALFDTLYSSSLLSILDKESSLVVSEESIKIQVQHAHQGGGGGGGVAKELL
jgi:hypothetical protein